MEVRPRLLQVERRPQEVRTPGEPWDGVRRLVVVRCDRVGDVVLTLPAVDLLRQTYPTARLALMVAPSVAPLARTVRVVDEVFEAEPRAEGMRRQLEIFGSDLVVCVSRGAAPAWAAARAGVPHRVGCGHRLYSPLFERRVPEHRRSGRRHEVEYALSFAHRAGAVAAPCRFPLELPASAVAEIEQWLAARDVPERFVVLHPGSGGSCPSWPVTHYLRLAKLLAAERVTVVLSVGPQDTAEHRALEGAEPALRSLPCFRGELPALACLLRRASLVVSNSTGPLHLAAAQHRPTLAFHAPWASCGVARWGPYSERGWALVAEHPGAARWSTRERRRHAAALMAGIRPQAALACAMQMLQGHAPQV